MQFNILAALTLATFAAAAPGVLDGAGGVVGGLTGGLSGAHNKPKYHRAPEETTIQQGNNVCGNGNTLACCNTQTSGGVTGLLSLLPGAALFSGCSKLSVTALIGVNDLLNDQCQFNSVCCSGGGETNQNGLVNLGNTCVPISNLL